jgi:hypothetical protein
VPAGLIAPCLDAHMPVSDDASFIHGTVLVVDGKLAVM